MDQFELFEEDAPPQPTISADPGRVRRKLDALLAEARAAGSDKLPLGRRRLMETVVPQMTRWLPEDEAARIKRAFSAALAA